MKYSWNIEALFHNSIKLLKFWKYASNKKDIINIIKAIYNTNFDLIVLLLIILNLIYFKANNSDVIFIKIKNI